MSTRRFAVLSLVSVLLLAGVGSFYASTSPDGLEVVAEQTGFSDSAEEHAADDGPLAGYGVRGVDDGRLSDGLAGVLGVLVTLLLMAGLVLLLRRRAPAED